VRICIHNSLQNEGMALLVVKILAARVQWAMDSDVLCICTFNAIWKIPANSEVSHNFLKYFFLLEKAYVVPVEQSIRHRL
jgi:hypothetical protein